jgi:hypothetical protein
VNPDIGIVLRGMDARALLAASTREFDVPRRARRHGPRQRCAAGIASSSRPSTPPPASRKVHRLRDPRLAEVELDDDGRPRRIKSHDKLAALTVLIKHLGGLPDERPVGVHNTQVNVIADERRVAALMTMIARAKSSGEISSGETRSAVAQSVYGHDEISWHDEATGLTRSQAGDLQHEGEWGHLAQRGLQFASDRRCIGQDDR